MGQRNPVRGLEGEEEQRDKVVDNCLDDVAGETGVNCVFVSKTCILLHGDSSFCYFYERVMVNDGQVRLINYILFVKKVQWVNRVPFSTEGSIS